MSNSVFTPETNPTIERLVRFGGTGGVIGGVLLAASYLTRPSEALPETLGSNPWIWMHAGFPMIVVQTGSIIFGAGLAWLGMSLCRRATSREWLVLATRTTSTRGARI